MDEHGIMRVPRLQPPPARSAGRSWTVGVGVLLLVAAALNTIYGLSTPWSSTGSTGTGSSHERGAHGIIVIVLGVGLFG